MKKLILASGIISFFIASPAAAQQSETALLSVTATNTYELPFPSPSEKNKNYPVIAEERFRRDFKEIQNAEWTTKPEGYRVYFEQDAVRYAVDYTKKGKLYSTIRYYGEERLSEDLKKMINATFSNHHILKVSEVKMENYRTTVYVIIVEDQKSLKTLQIMDGRIEILQESDKE